MPDEQQSPLLDLSFLKGADGIAASDQAETAVRQLGALLHAMAPVFAAYYADLIDSGFNADLAGKLMIEYHNLFWSRTMDADHEQGRER